MGLRYDISLAYLERFDRGTSTFDPYAVHPYNDRLIASWKAAKTAYDATNPKYPYPAVPASFTGRWLFAGKDGNPRRAVDTDYTNIAPRIGLAWRIGKNTVLRTGVGVFYENLNRNQNQNGFSQSTDYVGSLDGQYPSACANPASCQSGPPTGPYSLVEPVPERLCYSAGSERRSAGGSRQRRDLQSAGTTRSRAPISTRSASSTSCQGHGGGRVVLGQQADLRDVRLRHELGSGRSRPGASEPGHRRRDILQCHPAQPVLRHPAD